MLALLFGVMLSSAVGGETSQSEMTRRLIEIPPLLSPITEEYTKEERKADFIGAFQTGWKAAKGIDKREWVLGTTVGVGLGLPVGALTVMTLGFGGVVLIPAGLLGDTVYIAVPPLVPEREIIVNKTIENGWRIGYRSRIRLQRILIVGGTGTVGFFGGAFLGAIWVESVGIG